MRISAYWLPLIAATMTLVSIHLCLVISAAQGYVDWCVPYWADCVSISRSGRHGLAYFVFKGAMIPVSVLLLQLWWLASGWLRTLTPGAPYRTMTLLALVASLSLLTYTLVLGHHGEGFRNLRRFGVVLFLGFSFVNFALLAGALKHSRLAAEADKLQKACAAILAIALFSLVLDAWLGEAYDRLEDAFEWWLVLLLIGLLGYLSLIWKRDNLILTLP